MTRQAEISHRYHCFDNQGNKLVCTVLISQIPTPLPNHTEWKRGLGRMSEEQRRVVGGKISAKVKGVPKTQEQKHKMRLAKLGVPKSEEHKRNMSLSQLARAAKLREERLNGSLCSTS
jgi:hypothetical protein